MDRGQAGMARLAGGSAALRLRQPLDSVTFKGRFKSLKRKRLFHLHQRLNYSSQSHLLQLHLTTHLRLARTRNYVCLLGKLIQCREGLATPRAALVDGCPCWRWIQQAQRLRGQSMVIDHQGGRDQSEGSIAFTQRIAKLETAMHLQTHSPILRS